MTRLFQHFTKSQRTFCIRIEWNKPLIAGDRAVIPLEMGINEPVGKGCFKP